MYNKNKKFHIELILFILFPICQIFGQEVKNIHFEQEGKMINIYYDLIGKENLLYYVEIFCSEDGGQSWGEKLENVSGDTGENILIGNNKKIAWNVLSDRSELLGEINFKINVVSKETYYKTGFFTDKRDGQEYKWIKVGSQVWMAENINFPLKISWCFDNFNYNCKQWGRLYNWRAANKVCPKGWHLPSKNEWNVLITSFEQKFSAGNMLKRAGLKYWNTGTPESSGFDALPAGIRTTESEYREMGVYCNFWTGTAFDNSNSYRTVLNDFNHKIVIDINHNKNGLSVRCIKDSD